jgi:hypothetical protein
MMPSPESKKPYRRRATKPRTLGQHIGKLTKQAFGQRGFASGTIIAQWSRVVGDNLASLSSPTRIVYPRGKRSRGTLHLRIASGSIAVELQHMEPLLIQRINAYFGYRAVDSIQLQQAPLADYGENTSEIYAQDDRQLSQQDNKVLEDALSTVQDADLHDALERLGQNILRRKKP